MDTQKKLYIAIALLAVMGGALFMQNKKQAAESARHSPQGVQAELPQLNLTEEAAKKISKVVIQRTEKAGGDAKDDDDGAGGDTAAAASGSETRQEYVLERKGDDAWDVTKPMVAKANANNVKSMLDNLVKLKLSEQISASADSYKEWGLTDDKALHAVFYEGDKVVADIYVGDSGSRGQMTRLGDKVGVYAAKGFSKWVYDRDLKGWRDRALWTFDDKNLARISITNEHGAINLKKDGDKWVGEHKPAKGGAFAPIPEFKDTGVTSLISAYKSLNAVDFALDKTESDTGLDKPVASVTFELKDGSKQELDYGKAEGSNRWVRRRGATEIVSISSWTADWVVAGIEKFQDKKEEKKDEPPEDEGAGHEDPHDPH
jgi:hypothetical protein